ncbi:MAG: acyltransferase [Deltaproteobacteria bacterium]|nr:acyltransferase [Deltaproteobacteria bacterium]
MRMLRQLLGLTTGFISFVYLVLVLNPIQMMSLPLLAISRSAVRAINRWCARSIWGLWVLMAERQNGIRVRVTGDAVPPRENALLLPNHQSMVDVMALLCLAWRCGRLGDLKFFVKDVVKWFPGFGWGMWLLDCIFVKRDWDRDRAGVRRLFDRYKRQNIPVFLVTFLEGTRRTPAKQERARVFARERGLPEPTSTLVPRTKGFVATMIGMRSHLDAVYDIDIGYPGRLPTLMDAFRARIESVELHVRRTPIADLPTGEEELTRWAHECFRAKDERMARFASDRRFAGETWPDRVRLLDWFVSEAMSGVRTERRGV